MPGQWKEVVRLRFKGDRYKGHALDLSALNKLSLFQKMVAETAKELWRVANPNRKNLPPHFEDRTRLCLRTIEDGSATVPLEVWEEMEDQSKIFEEPKEVEDAVKVAYQVFEATRDDNPLPENFPKSLVPEYVKWCREIMDDESIEITPPNMKPISISTGYEKKLSSYSQPSYEDVVNIEGEVLEADVRQKQFQLWVDEKHKVLISFTDEQESDVTTALKEHNNVKITVKGRGEFSSDGKILRVKKVDELDIVSKNDIPYDYEAQTLGQILDELTEEIPEEELNKLPKDLSENLDHYIYGTPRL